MVLVERGKFLKGSFDIRRQSPQELANAINRLERGYGLRVVK
jgi:hypothetical protein